MLHLCDNEQRGVVALACFRRWNMSVIEFQTYIDHGTIELPKEYHDRIKGRARIIILTDEGEDDEDMVEFLLDHPYHIDAFTPLTRDEIYERR
jgi:hypothetical protein